MKNKHIYKFFDQTKKISELINKEEIEKLVMSIIDVKKNNGILIIKFIPFRTSFTA